MNRLLEPKNDSVDRQATFETDSTQARRSRSGGVKRGTLALPVIGSDSSLKTPPIKEGTFESDPQENQKNKKQTQENIHGKNGINVKVKNKNQPDKVEKGNDLSVKKKTSENLDKREKTDNKQETKTDSIPKTSKSASNDNNSKTKEPVTNTKTVSLTASKKDTENKAPVTNTKTVSLTVSKKDTENKAPGSKKLKEESLQLGQSVEQKSNSHNKSEAKVKGATIKHGNSNESLSNSSVKKDSDVEKKKDKQIKGETKDTSEKTSQFTPSVNKEEENKAVKNKENQINSISKKEKGNKLDNVSKTDEKPTADVKTKNTSLEVKNNHEKHSPQESAKNNKSEQLKQINKTKQDREKKTTKTNDSVSKSRVSVKSINEESEKGKKVTVDVDASKFDADAISIDLLQFEGTDSNSPPTSTALKDRHLEYNHQIDSFKIQSVPNDSQSVEKSVHQSKKQASPLKVEEKTKVKSDKPNKDNTSVEDRSKQSREDKDFQKSGSDRSRLETFETGTNSDSSNSKTNLSVNSYKAQDNNSVKSSSPTRSVHSDRSDPLEKHSYKNTSPRINQKQRSISPEKRTQVNSPEKQSQVSSPQSKTRKHSASPEKHKLASSQITTAKRENSPEKRPIPLQSFSPDLDRYESYETSDNHRMEPSKSRQPGAERMTESYDSVYAERKTLLDAEITYKKRIKQLEDELNQFLRTIEDLRAENKALRSRIDELESKSGPDTQQSVSHQSANTVVIDTEKIGLEARIEDLEKRNKELEQRNTESAAKVRLAVSENKTLSEDNEELRKKIEELENREGEEESNSSKDKLQKDSQETSKAEEENQKLTQDLKKVKSELDLLKNESEQLKKENEKYKKLQDLHAEEVEKLKQQIVDAKIETKKMEVEMEKYRELVTPRNDGAKSPNTEKMELKAQIIGLQTDNQSLNEELIKMKAEHLETLKKLHDLEKTANSFQTSVTAVESEKLSEIQTLKNENSKLQTENKTLQETLAQKKEEIQELMVVMKDDKFDNEIKDLNDDKTKLTKSLEEKDEENQKLKKEIDDLKKKNEELEKDKKLSESNVESLTKLTDAQKAEITEMQKKLDESKTEVEAEKNKVTNLAKAEKDIEEANSRASKFEKDLENERIKNSKEMEEIKTKHEKNIKELNDSHEQETEEWRKKYIELEKENQEEIRLLKLEIERLKGELEKLNNLKSTVKELEETKSEMLTLQNKYSQVVRDLEERTQVEERNFEMSLKIDALNKKVRQLEKENKENLVQKDNANDIDSSVKRLTEENKRLRDIVEKAHLNTKIEVLERKQKDAETRVKQLEGWVGDLYEEPKEPTTYAGRHRAEKKKKQPFSKAPVPTVSEKTNKRPRSLDEVNIKIEEDKMTHSSTPSLPNIFDREKNQQLSFGLGYSQIHRRRLNTSTKYKH